MSLQNLVYDQFMILVFAVINHNHLVVCNFDGVPYYDVSCWLLNMGIYYSYI
jgi:hypothetical protein